MEIDKMRFEKVIRRLKKTYTPRVIILLLCAGIVLACVSTEENKRKALSARRLGAAHYMDGNYAQALRKFQEAEALNPDDAELQRYMGLLYRRLKKNDVAIVHFNKALSIDPGYADAKNDLGTAYLAKKQWDTGISIFLELTEDLTYATPQNPLVNLGWAYYNTKNYSLSEKYYRQALDYYPKFIKAMRGLGLTYIAMGKIADAIALLERAVAISPEDAHLYHDLAGAYVKSGDYEKARSAYNTVIERVPHSPLAVDAAKAVKELK